MPNATPSGRAPVGSQPRIETISAATLATGDMALAVAFYEKLGFAVASLAITVFAPSP